jgi:hypothetical protein
VVEWQKRLDNTCHPEKAQESGNKQEHLPRAYLGTDKMAFCEYNADYQKDGELHQLKKLEPRNIVYQFYLSQ